MNGDFHKMPEESVSLPHKFTMNEFHAQKTANDQIIISISFINS